MGCRGRVDGPALVPVLTRACANDKAAVHITNIFTSSRLREGSSRDYSVAIIHEIPLIS